MNATALLLACLLPVAAWAQDSQVVAHMDGDWNGDGATDRAYVLMFPATSTYDLAVYTGSAGSNDMTLVAHMEGFGEAGGDWAAPALQEIGADNAFEVSMITFRKSVCSTDA